MLNYLNTYRRYACDIGRINEEARRSAENLVAMTENVFRHDLRLIADTIADVPGGRHVILLSGPSSSGKTTSSLRLADEFRRKGIDIQLISMDDFYLGTDKVGRLPDGRPDFESVHALDIPQIQECIRRLSTTGECLIPKYDFAHSRPSGQMREMKLSQNSVIIMEGIHALHPVFSEGMPKERVMKIYVSVKQGIKDNEEYVLTNRELRLIRRLIRDYRFRRTQVKRTLDMWDSVVDGEVKYIRPYRYSSDFTINSVHIYEPCVMKDIALEQLSRITPEEPEYETAKHLKDAVSRFESIDPSLIPKDSLLREFIGDGCYSY